MVPYESEVAAAPAAHTTDGSYAEARTAVTPQMEVAQLFTG